MDGGTAITITGQNLGVTSADIVSVVIGSSVLCTVIDYRAGRRYVYPHNAQSVYVDVPDYVLYLRYAYHS